MVLPSSGQISFNDIRVELNVSTQSPFSITDAVTGVYKTLNPAASPQPDTATPHAISEWYGYDHCIALNGGVQLNYNQTTPGDPGDCIDVINDYPFGQPFYSDNCNTLATSCKIYQDSICTNGAYNVGTSVRYITDGNNYFTLNSNSVVDSSTACN